MRACVVGHFGECSPDIHHLVELAAEGMAESRWRLMGARSEAEARAYFLTTVRRELSVRIWTAMVRHRLERLVYAGVPHEAVRRMRDENQVAFGRGGRVRGRAAPLLVGARLVPLGHVRPDDLVGYIAYQQPPARG